MRAPGRVNPDPGKGWRLDRFFLFCNAAGTAPDGKLDINGVFNELYAPGFPARQDEMVLVGVVVWDPDTSGRIAFRIDLCDPEGEPVFTIDGHTDVDERPPPRPPARTQFVLPMKKVIFPAPGRYRVRLTLDDAVYEEASMYLVRSEPQD